MALLLLLLAGADLSFGKGWEGSGFSFQDGLAASEGVGLLHRTLDLPADAARLEFEAALVLPEGTKPEGKLDVVLEAARREYLPRLVLEEGRWVPAKELRAGAPRLFCWELDKHAGRRVRLALMAGDARPGCGLVAGRFVLRTRGDLEAGGFLSDLAEAGKKAKTGKHKRYESRHFLAVGDAGPEFISDRLDDCEAIYPEFFKHFRKRGFAVQEPAGRLHVAVFRTQAGFDAYLGKSLGPAVTGLYHTGTNRLVLYDYATNPSFVAATKSAATAARMGSDAERLGKSVEFGRRLRERRDDVNVSTTMHEAAHQLSFNGGLLSRTGDVPAWLAEGLAVYCESSVGGSWQGIGAANPRRAAALARGKRFTVREMAMSDDWLRKSPTERIVLGYSQAWLLFRLLMEEKPKALRAYLRAIKPRRGADHRLADFAEAFGSIKVLEKRYAGYVEEIARREK
ncbi:MAG: DUF1570 domain-containing protein [Gemmataceae bacterium]|nr:DUF1570 domain-containing protein [Gemmataceae bacterium]